MLYFIDPQKLTVVENLKSFEYDMTLLTWTDSVTVNFTFVSDMMTPPSEFLISSDGKKYTCGDFSLLYVDLKKNAYKVRVTSKFSLADVEEILRSPAPPMFEIMQGGIKRTATYKEKAWKSDRAKIKQILDLFYLTK